MTMRVTMRNPRRSEDGLSNLLVGTIYTVSDEYGQALVQAAHAVDTDNVIAREDVESRDALLRDEVAAIRSLVSEAWMSDAILALIGYHPTRVYLDSQPLWLDNSPVLS